MQDSFLPHGQCYLWYSQLLGLHVTADALIAGAYYLISAALLYFSFKKKGLPFAWLLWLFAAFITACGTTHAMEIWAIWHPDYWLTGGVKLFTALLSMGTALLLLPLIPQMLSLRSPLDLEHSNRLLEQEIDRRRRSEAQFRYLSEGSLQGVIVHRDFQLLFVNQAAADIFGYSSPAEMLARETVLALFPDREHDRLLTGQTAQVAELTTTRHNGIAIVIQQVVSLVEWDGMPAVQLTVIDITAKVRAEQALHESEEKFRSLLETAPDAIIVVDEQGRIVLANSQTEALFGHTRSVLIGQPIEMLIPSRYRQQHVDLRQGFIGQAVRRPMVSGLELGGVRSDGEEFPVEISLSPVKTAQGQLVTAVIRNISERRRVERALHESEEKFRNLLETAPDAIIAVDDQGKIVLANSQTEVLFGHARSVLIGQPIEMLIPSRYRQQHVGLRQGFIAQAVRRPMLSGLELGGVRSDGEEFPVEISLSPVKTAQGQLVTAVIRDISEWRRVERALHESEEKFRNLLDTAPDAIIAVDEQGRIVLANSQTEALFGHARSVLIGQPIEMLIPSRYRQQHVDLRQGFIGQAVRRPMLSGLELGGVRSDGEEFPVEISLSPVKTAQGQLVTAVIRDISERRRVERALRQSEELYRYLMNVLDSSPVGNLIVDTDLRVVWLSQALKDFFVVRRATLVGKDINTILDSWMTMLEKPDICREQLQAGLKPQIHSQRIELHVLSADIRKERWLECRIQPITTGLYTGGFIMQFYDISEQVSMRKAFVQAQKMEAIGQLTGGIAHDFNNLLTIIIGNLQLLEALSDDNPELAELAQAALTAALRGSSLTRKLLAYSRKQPLEPQVLDVNNQITRTIDLLDRILGENIEVTFHAEEGLWQALVDPAQLEAALINLAINARDAMPGGGRLLFATTNILLDEDIIDTHNDITPGAYVVVAVTDNGTGMSDEVLKRAFEPFFTTKPVGKGSGLGLSMVYGFVRQSGGQVKIYSEPGYGTTIKLFLPRAMGQTTDDSDDRYLKEMPHGQGETVLVVEDDDGVRQVAVRFIRDLGYRVREAADAETALRLLKQEPSQVLFTDIVLGSSIDGIELARQVKILYPEMRVLFTSGYAEQMVSNHSRLDADILLVSKPYSKAYLARRLQRVLESATN